jgi:hypothetical protein
MMQPLELIRGEGWEIIPKPVSHNPSAWPWIWLTQERAAGFRSHDSGA